MQLFSATRRTVVSIVIIILSVFFGVNEDALQDIAASLDPPKVGHHHVTQVIDGDTIEVISGDAREKVRFIGIDTPETNHPDKAVQCFGHAAKNYLESLIGNGDVRLESDPTNTNRDRYDRLLRYVYNEDGVLLNDEMIREGYAFAYIAFPFQKKDMFVASESLARDGNLGLWSECSVEVDGDFSNTNPA